MPGPGGVALGEDMEQPRSFDHFDEANLDEEAKVRTPKVIKQLLAADSSSICPNVVVCCLFVVIKLKNCLLTATLKLPNSYLTATYLTAT